MIDSQISEQSMVVTAAVIENNKVFVCERDVAENRPWCSCSGRRARNLTMAPTHLKLLVMYYLAIGIRA